MILDRFFYSIDNYLPRKLAAWPYQLALTNIQIQAMGLTGIKVWARNSYKKGNFTFGVSDLDLTILIMPEAGSADVSRIISTLKSQKIIYPFLGEANFYYFEKLNIFKSSLNLYEKSRDPELAGYLQTAEKKNINVEKAVFLLRILYSDRVRIINRPGMRQKKWQEHFNLLQLPSSQKILFPDVLKVLSDLLSMDLQLLKETLAPLCRKSLTEQEVFAANMPRYWRFLYPNKHLWFHFGPEDELEKLRGTTLGQVCLKQIEWEVWGIMSQIPLLKKDKEAVRRHLKRLVEVSNQLSDNSEIPIQVEELLRLI